MGVNPDTLNAKKEYKQHEKILNIIKIFVFIRICLWGLFLPIGFLHRGMQNNMSG